LALLRAPFLVLGLWAACPPWLWAQTIAATLPVSGLIAVDRATNKIYVAGGDPGVVTVVDGVSRTTQTVPAGTGPRGVVVDEATNKIYVANAGRVECPFGACTYWGGSITIIDGATHSSTTISVPNSTGPCSVAVNPSTNRIYVGNCGSHNVSVLDGVDNSIIATVTDQNAKSLSPVAFAVNPTTNRIYVVNSGGYERGGNVTVIDGATNSTVTVTDPNAVHPNAVAVNALTNRIYVTNAGSCPAPATNHGNVTVIDGDTNSTTTVTDPNACYPQAVAINQTTNTIYVANANAIDPAMTDKGVVTVIDGATNRTATVVDSNGKDSVAVAVDEVTNRVYVANQADCGGAVCGANPGSISIIDGNTKAVRTLIDPKARGPMALAIDPVTNQIYVANVTSGSLTVVDGVGAPTVATLGVLLTGGGSGTVTSNPLGVNCGTTCTDTYTIGTAVKLVATAAAGSYFTGWSGPCTGTNACDVMMTVDRFVTAGFAAAGTVPNVVGTLQTSASSAVTDAGLSLGQVTQQSSSTVASGFVIAESPAAGTSVAPGSAVKLVVSSGPSGSGGGGGLDGFTLGSLMSCLLLRLRRVMQSHGK
jgi:DNA-binding beta-propeller fold protein YncE